METPGPFVHVVFFWLKEPRSDEARIKFENALTKFIDTVPGIRTSHIGTAADTDRPVIDSTYSYSLIVSFDSKREHDTYQEHPLHMEFIAAAEELWDRVQVYDSVMVNPI